MYICFLAPHRLGIPGIGHDPVHFFPPLRPRNPPLSQPSPKSANTGSRTFTHNNSNPS